MQQKSRGNRVPMEEAGIRDIRTRGVERARSNGDRERALRVVDVVGASTLLVLLSPLLLALALAIRLETRGPSIYRCRRIGKDGVAFDMLKFRKMHDGAAGGPLTAPDDERFTRLGRFLARTKLDELPQLWNVLRGDMSLVGPRPEDPRIVTADPSLFEGISIARPGITGYAQLAFRSESALLDPSNRMHDYVSRVLPRKLELDRLYLRDRSVRTNLRVLGWTLVAVASPRAIRLDSPPRALQVPSEGR